MQSIYAKDNKIMDMFTNIGEYFVDQALHKTQLVITGQNAGGNLSQKQIEDGMRPANPSIIQTNPYASQVLNSIGLGAGFNGNGNNILLIGGAVLVVGLIFVLRK